jgi:hypothetical protein
MHLNTYEDCDGWWVFQCRKTLAFRFWYSFELAGFRSLMSFMTGGLLGSVMFIALPAETDVFIPWYVSTVLTLATAVGGAAFGKNRPRQKSIDRLRDKGLLTRQSSYAYTRLRIHLEKLKIWIHDMNDTFDREVGMIPIHLYLERVAKASRLIDSGHLKKGDAASKAQHSALKTQVDEYAQEAATMIRYLFDQRELVRQAIEAGDEEKAQVIQDALDVRLAALASGEAEVWLLNATHSV